MKISYRTLLLPGLLLLSGCESVFVEQPLGEQVVVLDEALWQGQWSNGEIVITTSIIDAEKGILQAAWIERGEHGAELEMATGYVRQTGERIYLNLPNFDTDEAPGASPPESELQASKPEYHWARLVLDEHQASLWWPNQDRFHDAVKAGTLPGTVKEDQDVLLGTLSAEQLDLINSPQANLLNWTEPMVFTRIAD
ncbi:MAG TPA: hypothetical protein VJN01_00775 [Xanthomonadales bacterium]|nr:hypothetical protein [Xanthomonadales bacterium]